MVKQQTKAVLHEIAINLNQSEPLLECQELKLSLPAASTTTNKRVSSRYAAVRDDDEQLYDTSSLHRQIND